MFNKLKQIKELRDQAKTMKKELSGDQARGTSLNEQIEIIINGNQEIIDLKIDSSLLEPGNKEKIESGVKAAYDQAMKEIRKIMVRKFQSGDFKMPDLPNLG